MRPSTEAMSRQTARYCCYIACMGATLCMHARGGYPHGVAFALTCRILLEQDGMHASLCLVCLASYATYVSGTRVWALG